MTTDYPPDTRGHCDHCAAPMVSHNQWWRRMSNEERAKWRALGFKPKSSAGECHGCKSARIKREDAVALSEPYTRAELLEEWALLVDHSITLRANCRALAPRLGMRTHAMEKALGRAGVKAWPVNTIDGWDEWAS